MEEDEYFSYDGEDEECEEDSDSSEMWGTYAYAPFIYDIEDYSSLDVPMYSATHYTATMFYQKEIAIGMGAWTKKPMWDEQVPYFDALHEFWTGGMLDYLAEIRNKKENSSESSEEKGIPLKRRKMCERNLNPSL